MQTFKTLLLFAFACATALACLLVFDYYYYRPILINEGWLSGSGHINYGYLADGYTCKRNAPNYSRNGCNDNFEEVAAASLVTDENGFVTGGDTLKPGKDSSVFRIFITGGSAAWGSLQTQNKVDTPCYPLGNYSYASSIAGKLKAELQQRHPHIQFQVINAGVVGYTVSQSKALYETAIRPYCPDMVISIDGYNDLFELTNLQTPGSVYAVGHQQLLSGLKQYALTHFPHYPYALMLWYVRRLQSAESKPVGIQANYTAPDDYTNVATEPQLIHYPKIEPAFIGNASFLLHTIECYMALTKADGVHFIYCQQPMLSIRHPQKQLSPLELRLRRYDEQVTVNDTVHLYYQLPHMQKILPPYFYNALMAMESEKYFYKNYCSAFFFSNYLAPATDSLAQLHSQSFINLPAHLTGITADKEFYMDYCHLTPYANSFVASVIANKVDSLLAK